MARALFLNILLVAGMALATAVSFSPAADAADALGKVLVLPLTPGPDVDLDEAEAIDGMLAERMRKFVQFDVVTIQDHSKKFGRKSERALLRCGVDFKCLDKRLKRTPYDLLVVGKLEVADKNLEASFTVYNLQEGESKRTQTFAVKPGKFDDGAARKWTVGLFVPPEELLAAPEEEPVEEEVAEPEPEPKPEPRKKAVKEKAAVVAPTGGKGKPLRGLPSEQDVMDGIRAAYKLFVVGNIDEAQRRIKKVTEDRCACDADGKAFGLKAMLDAFKVTLDKAETALNKNDSKTVIGTLEEMKTLERELADEGRKLGVDATSKYAAEMNAMFARGYFIQGKGNLRDGNYLLARESFKQALQFDPANAEAKAEIDKMPTYAQQLFMQGQYMVDFEPEGAKRKLQQVLELVEPSSDLYKKAQKKLQEIEEQ
ncbi:MAG: hypothetical protein C4523_01250 [Myxococcales bacterium]|nr:MAG: hypothetical protein C4523_01250 [Myxococcales bacterium]